MKLLLIDGYSLLYRAFYSSPSLTTRSGQPTGALFGFIRMVLRLLDEVQPDCALVALDAHSPTFRHDTFEAYKANRSAAPDDLQAQTSRVREVLEGLSIPQYDHAGFEADDILGTLARVGCEEGKEVVIVTGDGDALQLVSERVSVMLTRRGVSEMDYYTPEAVNERYGFGPELLPDYKGLRGDSSDNIPGIPGIGEKTAIKLVSQFGGLESIYEKLEEVKPPRIRGLLETHREIAFQSRDLARIVTDLPMEIGLTDCELPRLQQDEERRKKALETVRELEFHSLLSRFAASDDDGVVEEGTKEEEPKVLLSRAAQLSEVEEWLESTSADSQSDETALLFEEGKVLLARSEAVLFYEGDLQELKSWLEDEKASKIVHDAKTVKIGFLKHGIELRGVSADTMLMSYLLEPQNQQHQLDVIAKKRLQRTLPELVVPSQKEKVLSDSLFAEESTSDDEESDQENEQFEAALATRASTVSLLGPVLREALEEIDALEILERLELPLVDILVSMERCGMLLDRERLIEVGKELESEAARLQEEIWELAGEEFNVGSPKQLQVILFEKLGLTKGRATKTGYSTDVHTLEKLAEENEIVQKILDYRSTTKLKSTYTDALLLGMDAETNRIHTSLNQTGTVTGRLSSSNPNLQNIPIRTEQGRSIRQAFIAPPGQEILKVDYSQIELRILAHIAKDEPLVEAFRIGEDVHSRTASDLFNVKADEVDAEMRRKAKMTNYAIAYGVSGFGLAKQLGNTTPSEGRDIIDRYFEAFPGVKKYMDDTLERARETGYVETLSGRRRPIPEINARRAQERAAAERTAINHPIQGTAADIMKIAMLAVYEAMNKRKMRSRMLLQVHDELVFEAFPEEIDELAPLLRELMTAVPQHELGLEVPLEVDIAVGKNWNDTESWPKK